MCGVYVEVRSSRAILEGVSAWKCVLIGRPLGDERKEGGSPYLRSKEALLSTSVNSFQSFGIALPSSICATPVIGDHYSLGLARSA